MSSRGSHSCMVVFPWQARESQIQELRTAVAIGAPGLRRLLLPARMAPAALRPTRASLCIHPALKVLQPLSPAISVRMSAKVLWCSGELPYFGATENFTMSLYGRRDS